MKPNELFDLIKSTKYKKVGLCANYAIIIDSESKVIRVLFEESNGFWDWIFNILYKIPVSVVPYKNLINKGFKVHLGIKIVWHMMRDEVMDHVKYLHFSFPDFKIKVSGWSHGGGQADMCAEDIYTMLNIKPLLTTFGGLRISGNKYTAEHFASCCADGSAKYENGCDFVPRLPFWFMGFRDFLKVHIGDKFNWLKFYKVADYHTAYGNAKLYV